MWLIATIAISALQAAHTSIIMEDGKNRRSSPEENKAIRKYGRQRTCSGTMSSTSAASTITPATSERENHRNEEGNQKKKACCSSWEACTHHLRKPIVYLLHMITSVSAHDPKLTIAVSLLLGCCMIMVGASTNFHVVVEQMTLWTPLGSKPLEVRLVSKSCAIVTCCKDFYVLTASPLFSCCHPSKFAMSFSAYVLCDGYNFLQCNHSISTGATILRVFLLSLEKLS